VRRLEPAALRRRTEAASLEALGYEGLAAACREHTSAHAPEPAVAVDERTDLPIVYSPARLARMGVPDQVCVVCDERTCPAVDVVELPGGDAAWLTPNLYPICYPFETHQPASGIHLVHWSSLFHDRGIHTADEATAAAIVGQLASAEAFLLHHAPDTFPDTGEGHRGHVGIIKNRGRRVGGSVVHDHQQIMLMGVPPRDPPLTVDLAPKLLLDTPEALVVERVHGLCTTLVPTAMWRPLQAFIVPHGPPVGWLHHLEADVLAAMAFAMARLSGALDGLMREQFGEPAWNLVVHTGPGCAPLIEARPFTQPLGGYEHLGIWLSEETPARSAERLREAVAQG
jgi:hypothetical protein